MLNTLFKIFLTICIFLDSDCSIGNSCSNTDTSFNCVKYIETIDGDTVIFDLHDVPKYFGENAHIRIKGIDAPELHSNNSCEKKAALKAKEKVSQILIAAKIINLTEIGKEKYGRILANIIADDTNIGEILLKEKLAIRYQGKTKKKLNWCKKE